MSHPPTGERQKVVIGSRASELAMIQSHHIQKLLSQAHPEIEFSILTSSTLGDEVLDQPLSVVGASNPGLFTKSLEAHIVTGRYDLAVHSLKDMPTTLPEGLVLSSITAREDPTDALVLHPSYTTTTTISLSTLPHGAVVGTSSLRRQALIGRYYPHLIVKSIRGNLNTRLAKLDQSTVLAGRRGKGDGDGDGEGGQGEQKETKDWVGEAGVHYDAVVLATAGLNRMGWNARVSEILHTFPYGISQGALGIETRTQDSWLNELIHSTLSNVASTLRCLSERSYLRNLQGGCQVPIGARTTLREEVRKQDNGDMLTCLVLTLEGIVLAENGSSWAEGKQEVVLTAAAAAQEGVGAVVWEPSWIQQVEALGIAVAEETKSKGADALLGRGTDVRPITYSEVATGNQ